MKNLFLILAFAVSAVSGCVHRSSLGYGYVVTLYADNGQTIQTWQANRLSTYSGGVSFVEYGSTRSTRISGTYTVVDVQ